MVDPWGMQLMGWADTLFVDFPDDDVPVLTDEKGWKLWGDTLIGCTSFALNDAPGTGAYKDWYSWAQQVYYTMNSFA